MQPIQIQKPLGRRHLLKRFCRPKKAFPLLRGGLALRIPPQRCRQTCKPHPSQKFRFKKSFFLELLPQFLPDSLILNCAIQIPKKNPAGSPEMQIFIQIPQKIKNPRKFARLVGKLVGSHHRKAAEIRFSDYFAAGIERRRVRFKPKSGKDFVRNHSRIVIIAETFKLLFRSREFFRLLKRVSAIRKTHAIQVVRIGFPKRTQNGFFVCPA